MMMGWWHIRRQGRGVFVHKHGKIYIIIILMMSLIMKLYICIRRRTTASTAWHVSRIIFLLFLFLCIHKAYDIARIIIYTFFILNFSSSFNSKDCIISSTYLSSHNTHTHKNKQKHWKKDKFLNENYKNLYNTCLMSMCIYLYFKPYFHQK